MAYRKSYVITFPDGEIHGGVSRHASNGMLMNVSFALMTMMQIGIVRVCMLHRLVLMPMRVRFATRNFLGNIRAMCSGFSFRILHEICRKIPIQDHDLRYTRDY
jgi:hypothetical protein